MHPTATVKAQQQCRARTYAEQSDSTTFFNLLTSPALLDRVEELLPDHRERLFPPTETLSMFLAQVLSADRSCQQVVDHAAVQRLCARLPGCSTNTGAYCRARQRLPLGLIETLTQELGEQISGDAGQWRWRGRRTLLVDGTTVTMPDTPANQAQFPQQGGQLPGLGFPICRIVGITCLASGALLNAAVGRFQGKGSGERGLLRELEETFQAGDVILGDAFYPTYFFIAAMQRKQVDLLMEQDGSRRRSTDYRKGHRLGVRDHLIKLTKPPRPDWMSEADYRMAPDSLTVRECQAGSKTLVTTLSPKVAKAELKALYQSRWHVELDLRHIKDTMGMDILSCKTPDMAVKEIWTYLLAYNLIRWVMAESALAADVLPREISFKHCLQIWTIWVHQRSAGDPELLPALMGLIAQRIVGRRPGRIEPRAKKRRPKAYPLLTKPRPLARQLALDLGHTKKLK